MITVNLKGGLGNQMFQYACARALSIRNNDELHLVRTAKLTDSDRSFSLVNFQIAGEISPFAQIGLWPKLYSFLEQKLLRRFYVGFDRSILLKKGNIYLDGYFQSEKYFIDQADTIRDDFLLKATLSPTAETLAETIKADQKSVSIHIRRGDYVKHSEFGGIVNQEYYTRAIAEILERVPDAKFYIFSDDVNWCRDNLDLPNNSNVVSRPDLKDYEELFLISLCRHNITANSSFSWWGAWLNKNPHKIVIAPKHWSNHHDHDWYCDIIPEKWIRM